MFRHRHTLLLLGFLVLLLAACKGGDKNTQSDDPGQVAVSYYNQLAQGKYEQFVQGMESYAHKPNSYQSQTVVLIKQHDIETKNTNGGIRSVAVNKVEKSEKGSSANVFLNITYKDGSVEEIDVPMVLSKNGWKML